MRLGFPNRAGSTGSGYVYVVAGPTLVPALVPIRRHQSEEQDDDADDDERVGEVEGRPVAEVEEIDDVAQADAVDEVRDAPADDEAERDRQNRMARAGTSEEVDHPDHCDGGQQDDERRR